MASYKPWTNSKVLVSPLTKGHVQNIFKLHIKHGTFVNALLFTDKEFHHLLYKAPRPLPNFFQLFFSNNSNLF